MNEIIYKMYSLYNDDFSAAKRALGLAAQQGNEYLLNVLWHEVIISYSRPFSGNRIGGKSHRLEKTVVPSEHSHLHDKIFDYCNRLVAHSDFSQVSDFFIDLDTRNLSSTRMHSMTKEFMSGKSWSVYHNDCNRLIDAVSEHVLLAMTQWHREIRTSNPASPAHTSPSIPSTSSHGEDNQA